MAGMAQAPIYTRVTDFSQDELNNVGGRSTVGTAKLDAELDNIQATVNALRSNLTAIQRDDGKLRDSSLSINSLDATVLAALGITGAIRGAWLTATAYAVRDIIQQGGNTYMALVTHTSGTFATDLSAGRWFQLGGSSAVRTGIGAATRAIAAKVQDFTTTADTNSLTGDMVADDSTALGSALTDFAASNRTSLHFVSGMRHRTTSNLAIAGALNYASGADTFLRGHGARIYADHLGTALTVGDYTNHGPGYRINYHVDGLNFFGKTGQDVTTSGSVGLLVNSTANVFTEDNTISGFQYGLKGQGALICDFTNLTSRDNGFGAHFTAANGFSPNSINLWGARLIENKLALYINDTSQGETNLFGCQTEGNNQGGNSADGKVISDHQNAGYTNLIGCHDEGNPGQINRRYVGGDVGKGLLIAGSQLISNSGTVLEMTQGSLTAVSSRITGGITNQVNLASNAASAVLINTETSLSGTLDRVQALRYGKTSFGANSPLVGDPLLWARPAAIADSGNIVARWQNNNIVEQFYNTAGSRVGYRSWNTGSNAVFFQDQAYGYEFYGSNAVRFFVARNGAQSIEPGAANAVLCGSAVLPWSGGNTQVAFTITSDERTKLNPVDIDDAALDAWAEVRWVVYQLITSYQEKGDEARLHSGTVAQYILGAFERQGLDGRRFALLCHDKWDDQFRDVPAVQERVPAVVKVIPAHEIPAHIDKDGLFVLTKEVGEEVVELEPAYIREVSPATKELVRAAGDCWSVRYEEAFAFEAAWNRREHKRMAARVEQLEAALAALKP